MSEHTQQEYDYWQAKFEQSQSEAQHDDELRQIITQVHQGQLKTIELQNEHFSLACQREQEAVAAQRAGLVSKLRLDLAYYLLRPETLYSERAIRFIFAEQANLLGLDIDQEIGAVKALKSEEVTE